MRLRLSVQRHKLPPANILWNVPSNVSAQAYTIARLLEDINAIIPLEAGQWGLEDYVVEVEGYECLHFAPIAQFLKDDDTVCIRPLLTAEVRARTLCGRYQINEGGQHLVDGVPFGRPLLRNPNRPQIRIPPRKRQRLLEEEDTVGADEPAAIQALITANGEVSPVQDGLGPSKSSLSASHASGKKDQGSKHKSVSFSQLVVQEQDEDSDEEEDDDFAPELDSDGEVVSGEVSSEEESGDSSEDSDTSSSDSEFHTTDTESSSDSDSEGESDSEDESDSEVDSNDDNESLPDLLSSKQTGSQNNALVAPGKGASGTRKRNKRRSQSKKLQKLKAAGILPAHATLQDMRDMYTAPTSHTEQSEGGPASDHTETMQTTNDSKKRKRGDESPTQEQMVQGQDGEDRLTLEQQNEDLTENVSAGPSNAKSTSASPETARKRLRPNVAAIERIITRQATQPEKKSPKANLVAVEVTRPPPDPDFWKSKINLSAFECWDEEVELSAPPFPFQQHWDPASKVMRDNAKKKKQQRNSRGKRASESSTTLGANDDSVILDYGDEPLAGDIADTETSAAIESQLLHDVATAAKSDLPELPDDVQSLPTLDVADIRPSAVIVFKLFEIDPKTMSPQISGFKTAIVEKEGDSGNGAGEITLKLAERDRFHREKKFDKKGNRIIEAVDKFQMDDSEEEEDDGVILQRFADLIEAKLLKAA